MEIYCSELLTKTVITKRIYTNSYEQIQECFYVNETKDIYSGCCYMLPPNYSAVGKKVPIIIWFDGNAGYTSLGSYFTSNENQLKGLKYLRDEGYAVIQVFGWGSYFQAKYSSDGISCGYDTPCCTPTNIACIKKGIELFCEHYNVDNNDIHVIGKSFGGLMSLYLATNNFLNVKSISMFSPLLDIFAHRGRIANTRKAMWEDLSMHGGISGYEEFIDIDYAMTVTPDNRNFSDRCVENTWRNNLDVLAQINPAFTGLIGGSILDNVLEAADNGKTYWEYVDNHDLSNLPEIYTNTEYKKISSVPIKIWGVTLDDNVPYANMVEVVNQVQNAGNRAELHTESNSNHSLYDASSWNAQSGITELGINYTDVPFGWVDAIKWIKTNSVK
jgi:pimeloyl-ACP methyl ester carboxylesterase